MKKRPRFMLPGGTKGIGALIALVVVLVLRLLSGGPDEQKQYDHRMFQVVYVVDGDTLDINAADAVTGKATTRIRLWGVDTPETSESPGGAAYYGEQAKAFARELAEGKTVRVELEPYKSPRDKYQRLLAYVFFEDDRMLNEMLIAQGLGYADERFDHIYKARFIELGRRAMREKQGLWAEVQWDDFPQWYQKRHPRGE